MQYNLLDGFVAGEEDESIKADLDLIMREEWPDNYCKAVINVYNEHNHESSLLR